MSAIPQPGDRVRVTYEGTVSKTLALGFILGDQESKHERFIGLEYAKVEVLEPAYEPGRVYVSARGTYFLRLMPGTKNGAGVERSWRRFDGMMVAEDFPLRPLCKLVPESEK